jgi:tetraacyldisaccharide 4'-kinase
MNFFKPAFWDKNEISFFSILLFPISIIINFLGLLKQRITKVYKSSVPVVCIGNIYLGGTGKTPTSIEIFSILKELGMNPAFIRKKYNFTLDEVELQKRVGPTYQNRNRIEAVKEAISDKANIIILDDGFQDFSITKNLSIVCFNENQWIGNGFIIPAGPLRENLSALKRANCVFINGNKNTDIENKIMSKNKKIKIFYTMHELQSISNFENKKIIAFAGIGNPENFFSLLKNNNLNILENIKYPDHHKYSEKELNNLIKKSKEKSAILLTTEKDYFRIQRNYKQNISYIKIKTIIENKDKFIEEIKKII